MNSDDEIEFLGVVQNSKPGVSIVKRIKIESDDQPTPVWEEANLLATHSASNFSPFDFGVDWDDPRITDDCETTSDFFRHGGLLADESTLFKLLTAEGALGPCFEL